MNSKENEAANRLLTEAIDSVRLDPEKSYKLMLAYKELQAAYAIRVEAEKKEGK